MSCDIQSDQLWSWVDRSAPELDEHVVDCDPCRRQAMLLREQTEALKQNAGRQSSIPESIGSYKLIGIIGRGGMGVVYRAIQPGTERHVAVKVMWNAFEAQPRFVKFFEREIKALGRLSHPNIARVYESGQTELGQRFLVMELVEGVSIDKFVRSDCPSNRELVHLFVSICDAIAHAHEQRVLHRDIKPSNIMITADSEVRVLDFGLARFTDSGNAGEMTTTAPIPLIGTLPYISPEQLEQRNENPTAQSDVYALGVMLYELLTGQLPFTERGSKKEMLDAVCRGDYVRPRSLDQTIDQDLNTIVQAAMEIDPKRRYPSTASFRDDLIRYLSDRPVHARNQGLLYKAGKAFRRNRVAFAIAGFVFATLLGSSIVSTGLFFQASRAEALANSRLHELGIARDKAVAESNRFESESRKSQRISKTLSRIFNLAQPLGYKPNRLTHEALTDEIASIVDIELAEYPAIAANMHTAIGESILYRSGRDTAEQHFRKSLELRLKHDPQDKRLVGDGHFDLGSYFLDSDRYEASIPHFQEAITCYRQAPTDDQCALAKAQANYGVSLIATNQIEKGMRIAEDALGRLRNAPDQTTALARALERLAYGHEHIGRYRAALNAMSESVSIHRERKNFQDLARTLTALAKYATRVGDPENARVYLDEAMSVSNSVVGMTNPLLAHQLSQLCDVAVDRNDLDSAQNLAKQAYEISRGFADQHNRKDHFAAKLGGLVWIRGDYDEAERVYRNVLAKVTREYGPSSDECISSTTTLGVVLRDKGDFAEAEFLLRKSHAMRRRILGPDHNKIARVEVNLARLLFLTGNHIEGEELARHALSIRERMFGLDHFDVAESHLVLGMLLTRQGELVEARSHIERASAIRFAYYPDGHRSIAEAQSALGELLLHEGNCNEGGRILDDANRSLRQDLLESHRNIKLTKERLATLDACSEADTTSIIELTLTRDAGE